MLLRDAAAAATFCLGCDDLVRDERCDNCGAAVRSRGYVVERVLVSNAHGRMYVAHDADGKQVALKELAFVHAPSLRPRSRRSSARPGSCARSSTRRSRASCASFEEGRGVHTRYYLAQELIAGTALDARLRDHWYHRGRDCRRRAAGARDPRLSAVAVADGDPPRHQARQPPARARTGRSRSSTSAPRTCRARPAGSTSIGTFGYMPIEQLAGSSTPPPICSRSARRCCTC